MEKTSSEDEGHTPTSVQTVQSTQPLIINSNASISQRPRSGSYTQFQSFTPPSDQLHQGHSRRGSATSFQSRVTRSGSISHPGMSPTPPLPSSTHAGGIQPPAAFFRPSRPTTIHSPKRETDSPVSLEGHTMGDVSQNIHNDALNNLKKPDNDSNPSLDVTNPEQPITRDPTPVSTVDSRRRPARLQLSREPLLPIGGSIRRPPPTAVQGSANSEFRNSFDRIFKRRSVDSRKSFAASARDVATMGLRSLREPVMEEDKADHWERGGVVIHPATPRSSKHSPSHRDARGYLSMPNTDGERDSSRDNDQPGFHPYPPKQSTNLRETPVLLKSGKLKRNYEDFPSNNVFPLNGRLITGGGSSPLPFIGTVAVVLGLTGVWFATTAVWWWKHSVGGIVITIVGTYLTLLTLTNMFVTAFKDPGILPRDLDLDPPYPEWESDAIEESTGPLPRDILVRNNLLRVKYCSTCRTYRPPRSIHCRLCDNCVDGCDHHCQWLNTCVGRRNYTSFVAVLVFGTLDLALVIVTSALHLSLLHTSFKQALKESVGSAVIFILGLIVLAPVSLLLGYHIRLIRHNLTTVEKLRANAHSKLVKAQSPTSAAAAPLPNPFEMKWYYNIAFLLCRPDGYDWIEAREPAYEDKREINPGVIADLHDQRRRLREQHLHPEHDQSTDPGHGRDVEIEEVVDAEAEDIREMNRDARMSMSQGHRRLESVDEHSDVQHEPGDIPMRELG